MIKEEWKYIEGYEGLYQISSEGRVKSLSKPRRHVSRTHEETTYLTHEKMLKGSLDSEGYVHVRLKGADGRYQLFKIHTLVAQAFLGYSRESYVRNDIEHSLVVIHKNGDNADNRLENLEVMTLREKFIRKKKNI